MSKWGAHDETKHVDFSVQTLWTLAHVQESPLDKIYVLLMIFIGPLAQSSGKLPRNLKESCFWLVVRMQRVIKFRKGMVKAKILLFRYNDSSQHYNCEFSHLFFFFLRLWNFLFYQCILIEVSFKQCLEKCCFIHLYGYLFILWACTVS